jgi:hypothetical protein
MELKRNGGTATAWKANAGREMLKGFPLRRGGAERGKQRLSIKCLVGDGVANAPCINNMPPEAQNFLQPLRLCASAREFLNVRYLQMG